MLLAIVDGYTDEPAGLGVPPYLGIYPRILAGAAKEAGFDVFYLTVDDLRVVVKKEQGNDYIATKRTWNASLNRKKAVEVLEKADYIVAIAGVLTPGKYLSAAPAPVAELAELIESFPGVKVLGGPAAYASQLSGGKYAKRIREGFDYFYLDPELFIAHEFLGKEEKDTRWYIKGAFIAEQAWQKWRLVAEIELGRGCIWGKCSFCTEPLRYRLSFRDEKEVIEEMKALKAYGVRFFRLGRIADFWSYKFRGRPNVEAIKKLLVAINRLVAPEVLHIDNADPHVIAAYPEGEKIAKIVAELCTEGNVASLGIESVDPRVIKLNRLNSNPEEALKAIEILNRVGREKVNGLPKLLPGINFVFGLIGERKKSFKLLLSFLDTLLQKDLWVRRINLREVAIFPGTLMAKVGTRYLKRNRAMIKHTKYVVRHRYDPEFLRRIWPKGSRFKAVAEIRNRRVTYLRWMGSYPLVVKVNQPLEIGRSYLLEVTGHGARSVEARVIN